MQGSGQISEEFSGKSGKSGENGDGWGERVLARVDQAAQQIRATRPDILRTTVALIESHLDVENNAQLAKDHELRDKAVKENKRIPKKTDLQWLDELRYSSSNETLWRVLKYGGDQLHRTIPFLSLACAKLDKRAAHDRWDAEDFGNFLRYGLAAQASRSAVASDRFTPYPLAPIPPGNPDLADGDGFFNAERGGLNAIAANLDILRSLYEQAQPVGLRDRIFFDNRPVDVLMLSGPSGVGKTVLLERIAHDALRQNWAAYQCHGSQITDTAGFLAKLNEIAAREVRPLVVLIEGANEALRRGLALQALAQFTTSVPAVPIKVIFAGNIALMSAEIRSAFPVSPNFVTYHLRALDNRELDELLEKLRVAELNGTIRHRASTLTTEERLAKLESESDRVVLVALLMLRYGKSVREVLREEYSLLLAETKNILKRCALLEQIDCGFPASKLASASKDPEFFRQIKHMTRQLGGSYFVRHPRLSRPTLDVALPSGEDRCHELVSVLREVNGWGDFDSRVLIDIFTMRGIAPRIKQLFRHEKESLETFVSILIDAKSEFLSGRFAPLFLSFLGQISKDALSDYDNAVMLFEHAASLDPSSAFIRRQLAWSYYKQGNHAALAEAATKALADFPEAVQLRSDCAILLARTAVSENVRVAHEEISSLVRANPKDRDLRRRKETIDQFESIRSMQPADSELPDWALEKLPMDRFAWRTRRNGEKFYKKILFSDLCAEMSSIEDSPELLNELNIITVNPSDKRMRAVIKSNLGRSLYQRWYSDQEDCVDLGYIQSLLEESIKLWPDEPFAHCWLGTFLKEARHDLTGAMAEYRRARAATHRPEIKHLADHPLILNNMALLKMDQVRDILERNQASVKDEECGRGLMEAWDYLSVALDRMKDYPRFTWPLTTKIELEQLFLLSGLTFPDSAALAR